MSAVSFQGYCRKALQTMRRLRNGRYPEASVVTFMQEETNRILFYRVKGWSFFTSSVPAAGGAGHRNRWRAHFRSSTHASYLWVRFIFAPSGLATNSFARLTITVPGAGVSTAVADAHGSNQTGSDSSANYDVISVPTNNGSAVVTIAANTTYQMVITDADNARLVAACVWEIAKAPDTDNGYLNNGVVAGQPIFDNHRGDMIPLLRSAWLAGGAPLITWSSDTDAGSPTITSATITNLIDAVTGAPTAATAGFTLRLANMSTIRRTTIPIVMAVWGKCAGVGNGHVYLTDSAGTDHADVEVDSSTEAWFTVTATIPATNGKFDLRFNGDGVNLLTIRAVSVYQYEAAV